MWGTLIFSLVTGGRPFLPSYAASLPHVLLPYLAYGRSWLALGWAEIVHRFCVAVGGEAVVVLAFLLWFWFLSFLYLFPPSVLDIVVLPCQWSILVYPRVG